MLQRLPGRPRVGQGDVSDIPPSTFPPSYQFLARSWPIFIGAADAEVKAIAHERCVQALAYALRERDRIGEFPLEPAMYPLPMADPFGGTLRIKRTDRGIRIYSVGPDGVDNGGIAWRELAKPDATEGYDVVAAYPPLTRVFQIEK